MGSGVSKPDGPVHIPDDVARIGFPHTVFLSWKKSWSKLVLLVSTHKGSTPLYAASMPLSFAGPTVIYPGEDIEGSPMAYVERKHNDFTLQLPGVPLYGIMPSQAAMKCEHPYSDTRYCFTMPVGNGQNQRFESFEWRHSSGDEIKSLGMSSSGWKLVRMSSGSYAQPQNMAPQYNYGPPQQYSHGYSPYGGRPQSHSGPGFTSDGKEVVAVFADAKSFSMSMTDVGAFKYMGSGATPEMGYHWALMALITGIAVFQHRSAKANEQNAANAAVNASSAAAAASA